jgi:predicted RNA-binding protein with PUA-like domain
MAYWLFKTEAGTFSWEDQLRAGPKGEEWNGVRNWLAQKHMREMKIGDLGFFYHSGDEKSIVGTIRVASLIHPDSTDSTGHWNCVDVAAVDAFPKPVTLAAIKAEPRLAGMVLVKNSRLSVQPVTPEEWDIICAMGGYAPKSATPTPGTRKRQP